MSGPPAPRPICPHHLDAGAKLKLRVRPGEPTPLTVAQLADTFQEHEWQQHVLKEGSKGFIVASIACRRIVSVRNGLPGSALWLIVRRNPDCSLQYFLSNAPLETSLDDFATVSALRWPIETILNKPSSFSDSTNMKLAVGSVGIII
ncbi:hypothetical protein KFU94_29495 [Chloroflexi bacterium TSY]|nr:hypothetical protein [Chloroflexi bacterium TSY]